MKTKENSMKVVIGIVIVVLAIIVAIVTYVYSRHSPTYSTFVVSKRDMTQSVRVSGKIVPEQISSLSFSMQGKIQAVTVVSGQVVHRGDVLAYLDSGTTRAQLDGAKADLIASQSQLNKLEQGTRPEELALYNQKYSDASDALIVAMNNAYLQASDAVTGKADTLFTNGNSVNPVLKVRTDSQNEKTNLEIERVSVRDDLINWKSSLSNTNTSTSSISNIRSITTKTLQAVQSFLNHLSTTVGNLSVGNSGLSQATIDNYVSIVNGAQQELTGAYSAYTIADSAWSSAKDSLTLQNAGSRDQDLVSQLASTAKAQAQVEAYQSALSQSVITAPFDGTITNVDMKVGEVVVPGISADESIGIINTNLYNIETYVPENTIGNMTIGNPAQITFDAYGPSVIFPATVYLVSPSETVRNGVNSYKVSLRFDQDDARIRSGLTVNTVITTATATNALSVPTRALITKGNQKFVLLKNGSSFKEQPVNIGISSQDGYTEIVSGLNEGDIVANFGTESY